MGGRKSTEAKATQALDFEGLAEALKPKPRDLDETMAGFKAEFGKLVDSRLVE